MTNVKNRVLYHFRKISRRFFSHIAPFNHTFVVLMDGGICSQINQYMIGRLIAEKGNNVYYDLTFFNRNGKDCIGLRDRNFDLLKLFPTLTFNSSGKFRTFVYSSMFKVKRGELLSPYAYMDVKAPCYLDGYYSIPKDCYSRLSNYGISIIDGYKQLEYSMLKSMRGGHSCGIHVRRGDLSDDGNIYYGKPASVKYFLSAMEIIRNEYPDTFFYFFSDDMVYVKSAIVPLIPDTMQYSLVEGNGDDKGYLDLAMLSHCNFQVASIGSFGKYAFHLNKNGVKGIVLMNTPESREWLATIVDGKSWVVELQ